MNKLMLTTMRTLGTTICMLVLAQSAHAVAPDFLEKLNAESRPLEDKARDGARRPYQVMQLLGIKEGMTAVDVGAGGGWYTRVLSAAVGPKGKVYAQFGARALQNNNGQAQKTLAGSLGNVEPVFGNLSDIPGNTADVAIAGLNLHHGDRARNVAFLRDILNVLKPGGMLALEDHAGNPGADNAKLHRMLESDAKAWLEEAGFEIVQESNILRTAGDDRTRAIDDPVLGRNTDRFLFIVRKPAR